MSDTENLSSNEVLNRLDAAVDAVLDETAPEPKWRDRDGREVYLGHDAARQASEEYEKRKQSGEDFAIKKREPTAEEKAVHVPRAILAPDAPAALTIDQGARVTEEYDRRKDRPLDPVSTVRHADLLSRQHNLNPEDHAQLVKVAEADPQGWRQAMEVMSSQLQREAGQQPDAASAQPEPPQAQPEQPVQQQPQVSEAQAQAALQAYQAGLMANATKERLIGVVVAAFPDIRTQADVERLREHDPKRYIAFQEIDAAYRNADNVAAQVATHQQQQQQHHQQQAYERYLDYAAAEDQKFEQKNPEFADPQQASAAQKAAVSYLHDLGFEDRQLAEAWSGRSQIDLHDHRVQQVLLDASRWRAAQARAREAQPAYRPPMRPTATTSRPTQRELSFRGSGPLTLKQASALYEARGDGQPRDSKGRWT
jgi:hypothetical protein